MFCRANSQLRRVALSQIGRAATAPTRIACVCRSATASRSPFPDRAFSAAAAVQAVEETSAPSYPATPAEHAGPSEQDAGARMRDVLRSVAQPVVIAVARTHRGSEAYHGATLTSFASLTLEPHPLVAFSLRLPSRMADLLRPCTNSISSPIQLTISLSAGVDQPIADALAKPGQDQGHIFAAPQWNGADPPALVDAVGHLQCEVVHSLPLKDVGGDAQGATTSGSAGSELFICKVVDAERGTGKDSLVHYQRDYYSVSSHEHE